MRKWIEKILPGYSVLPLILAVSINMLVYFGTSQLRDYLTFHTITTALDEWIPFVAPFILFYVLAYIQWIANYLLVAREGKEFCYRIVYGDVAAKVICLLFFLFFPTTLARPEVTGSGFCNDLVRFIYRMDAPVNLFPSIHSLFRKLVLYPCSICHEKTSEVVSLCDYSDGTWRICIDTFCKAACVGGCIWRNHCL